METKGDDAFTVVLGTYATPDEVRRVERLLDAADIPFRLRPNTPGLAGAYFSIQTTDVLVRDIDEARACEIVE